MVWLTFDNWCSVQSNCAFLSARKLVLSTKWCTGMQQTQHCTWGRIETQNDNELVDRTIVALLTNLLREIVKLFWEDNKPI